jgi:DNA repair protein RadC
LLFAAEFDDDMAPRRKVAETSSLVESAAPKLTTLTIKDLDPSERPRERLIERGPEALSTTELLAILLRTGVAGLMVTDLARDLLRDYAGLRGLARASAQELATRHGLGPAKAAQLKAALEIGHRLVGEEFAERPKVGGPEDLANLVRLEMEVLDQEQLRVFLLDTKNRVVRIHPLYVGSLNQSTVRVAEVFKAAIRENCASVAVAHNHPSGDPTPSPEDIRVTQDLVDAGRLLDIEVLDHIIIGRGPKGWLSMRQRGLGFRS